MKLGVLWCLVALAGSSQAESWRWPEGSASVRIDTKIGFLDQEQSNKKPANVQDDDVPFREPLDTAGFYNQPPGAGRFPVRVEGPQNQPYRRGGHIDYAANNDPKNPIYDGTLDTVQVCKCLSSPECNPRPNSESACGSGKFLCCFNRPKQQYSEFFNEVVDERPMLLPGNEQLARPFPPPSNTKVNSLFGPYAPGQQNAPVGVFDKTQDELNGVIAHQSKPHVLVGPGGPTGHIGPAAIKDDPRRSESAQRGVLVGPGGPTGIIGPGYGRRPVLVGPGGPTGIIGPGRGSRGPGILVGPGGPTGIIGPSYGRQRPPVLVGPGGPTGIIGPRRPYYADGPTGMSFFNI